ncbi:MAG: hypothetical protein AB1725_00505 [Armatimonadota bacterium]
MNKRDWVEVFCRGAALLLLVLAVEAGTGAFAHWLAWGQEPIPASWLVSPIGNFVASLILWFGAPAFASATSHGAAPSSSSSPLTRESALLLVLAGVSLYMLLNYAYSLVVALVIPAIQGTITSIGQGDPYESETLIATVAVTALSGAVLYYSLHRLRKSDGPMRNRHNPESRQEEVSASAGEDLDHTREAGP